MLVSTMFPEIDAILNEENSASGRSRRIAEVLAQLLPGLQRYGCRLLNGAQQCAYIVDGEGHYQEDDVDWDGLDQDNSLYSAPVEHGGHHYGELLVGLAPGNACEEESRKVVDALGKYLGVSFRLEGEQRLRHGLESELAASRHAKTAAGIGQVCHDVRNVLNNIILQISILKTKMPQDNMPVLEMLRDQVLKAGGMLRSIEQGGSVESS